MKAVIMAGGKGTRVLSLTNDSIPKPMLEINNKPILLYQIQCMKQCNIFDIIIVIGHKGEIIEQYFGDGKKFGVSITYFRESVPMGTAGALYYLKDKINDNFFLVYGDIIFDIDLNRMMSFHKRHLGIVTLFTHPNSHPYDSDLIITDEGNKVIAFDSKNNLRNYYNNCVNAGLYVFSQKILNYFTEAKKFDMEKDLISNLIPLGEVFAYRSPEYVKDVGTPERISSTEQDILSGIVQRKNLRNLQKCIFLDRDGTVNKYVGLVDNPDKLKLENTVTESIKLINKSEYLCIIVTNQPVVARGLCEIEDVEEIHKKLKTLLGNDGAFLDDIFYCPHHPDKGYPEENPMYKIKCDCRKPAIGMLLEASNKYNISLVNSYMVGDTTVDIRTGKNAGCKTVLVQTGEMGKDKKYNDAADFIADNLYEAVNQIIQGG